VKFGLALPHYDFSLPGVPRIEWSHVSQWAQKAEQLGFSSVWVSDHLFLELSRYGGSSQRQFAMECFTTLAGLSSCTNTVRLGSLVSCNEFRHPALLAKMAASLNAISDGRLELGLGAGWYEPEFKSAGIPFSSPGERISRLSESVRLLRTMLVGQSATFRGTHYQVEGANNVPLGNNTVPVWIGGKGDRVVKMAGRYADGYNSSWAWTPEDYRGRIALLNEAAAAAGRDPESIRKSVGLYCLPGESESEVEARWLRYRSSSPPGVGAGTQLKSWRKDKLAGPPDVVAQTIDAFAALGVSEIILSFGLLPFQIADAGAPQSFMSRHA